MSGAETADRGWAVRTMARGAIVERLTTRLADEYGWSHRDDVANARQQAEIVVDALIEDCVVFASERWDEDCHRCEKRIGDHMIDGRCPA